MHTHVKGLKEVKRIYFKLIEIWSMDVRVTIIILTGNKHGLPCQGVLLTVVRKTVLHDPVQTNIEDCAANLSKYLNQSLIKCLQSKDGENESCCNQLQACLLYLS